MSSNTPLEQIDITQLQDSNNQELPPLPDTEPEYDENVETVSSGDSVAYVETDKGVQNYDDSVDWGSMRPVDESGYTNPTKPDFESLKPYDVTEQQPSVFDETKIKFEMGNLTNFRAQTGRDVMSGKISVEEAKARVAGRHGEILNKFGITQVPEFSFSKFRHDPLRTILGETAQMLPFYGEGVKKGLGYAAILGPATAWLRGKQGQAAGAVAGTVAEPGAGTVAGAGVGRTAGLVEGFIEGTNNGMLLGTFHTSMDVEGMNLYLDMREKGIDHKTALTTGMAGGLADGILETCSFGVMTAPIKGAAKKAAAKLLWDGISKSPTMKKMVTSALMKVTTEYFKRIGVETSTEMAQDVVNNTMMLIAAQASGVEDAKPTGEDWKNILTKTAPQTLAAMSLMGLFSTPFDIMNAEVGSVKNEGGGDVATTAEVEQNITDLSEGESVSTGSFTLEGKVMYNTVADGDVAISELEAEHADSESKIQDLTKQRDKLSSKENLNDTEKSDLQHYNDEIAYEKKYQGMIREEIIKTSEAINNKEKAPSSAELRKKELTEKGRKEKLSADELEELNNIWIDEEKTKGETNIEQTTQKARERVLNKNIRDLDADIQKTQKKEDKARENRNKLEKKQDDLQSIIDSIEKENTEIEKALVNTDIESDKSEMQATLARNKETIKEVKGHIKSLEQERTRYSNDVENAMLESDALANKRAALDSERANLSEGILDENGKVEMTAGGYKNIQLSALKSKLKAMNEGIKRGVRLTRREIRDVQNSAIHIVKNSAMSDKDKTKFFVTIRDLNSREKFSKALPELWDKINSLEEKTNKNNLVKYIGKLLKQGRPKKTGKTPVGKFNADIQSLIDEITAAANKTTDEAYAEIEKIFDSSAKESLTDEQTQKVRILYNFSGLKDKTSSQLLSAARAIRMLIEDGKIAGEFREAARKAHKEKVIEEAKDSIIGTVEITGNRKLDLKNQIKQAFRTFGSTSDSWDGLMNILSLHDKDRRLAKILDVFPAKMEKIKGQTESFNTFFEKGTQSLNCKNSNEFSKRIKKDSVIEDIGEYVNRDGEKITLQASRCEARKLFMEMMDPTLERDFKENNKYTFKNEIEDTRTMDEDSNDALNLLFNNRVESPGFTIIDKSTQQLLDEYLTAEDKAFIDSQLKFYRDYHKRVNSFYREKFGIDMPYNDSYSPIQRITDGGDKVENWLSESVYQTSMVPSAFRERKKSSAPVKLRNDMAVMQEHIALSEHFMAMDKFVTDAESIFKKSDIREIIIEKYGKKALKLVDQQLKDIKSDGVESTRAELGFINSWRTNFTAGALGLKAQIELKQFTAVGVFADAIPTGDFVSGMADFLKNPIKASKILSESYLLKDRANSINMEIRDIVRSQEFSALTKHRDFRSYMYFFTQHGDRWSIIAGGWAVYKSVLNKTGDTKAAMDAFERAADQYQQSGHIDQQSAWQRGNSLQKCFTMFMSDQMKQLRAEVHAVRDAIIFKDQEHIIKAAKTVLIMHVILPNLVQLITNGFKWDDEDQIKATILGPFTSIAVAGQILSMAVTQAIRLAGGEIEDFESLDVNVLSPFNDLKKHISKLKPEEITGDDVMECLLGIGKDTVGPLAGLPIKYVSNVTSKAPEYLDEGEFRNLGMLLMGWSPYVIEKKGQKSDEEE